MLILYYLMEGSVRFNELKQQIKQKIKNTILYIQQNFDHIYQVMLETLLPTVTEWEMQNYRTGEPVTTFQQLHDAHGSEVIAGMEARCITNLQLNCKYQKDDMVFYPLIYHPDICDEGFGVVFWKDHVVFFIDGNTEEAIFEFEHYKEWPIRLL